MGDWKVIQNGSQLDFADNFGFRISQAPGTGFSPVENIYVDYGLLDGGLFQRTRTGVKSFSLVGTISGSSVAGLLGNRRALIDAVKPDRTSPQEPVVIQYTGGASTLQASAYYDGGLELGNVESFHEPRVALNFLQFDPYWEVAASDGAVVNNTTSLGNQEIVTASYFLERQITGQWTVPGSIGWSGVPGTTSKTLYDPSGRLYLGAPDDVFGGSNTGPIVYLENNQWTAISACTGGIFSDMALGPNRLYALNIRDHADQTQNVCSWIFGSASIFTVGASSGQTWTNTPRNILVEKNNSIFMTGNLTAVGSNTACGIAWFDGTEWWGDTEFDGGASLAQTYPLEDIKKGGDGRYYVILPENIDAVGSAVEVSACGLAAWDRSASRWYGVSSSPTEWIGGGLESIAVGLDGTMYFAGACGFVGLGSGCTAVAYDYENVRLVGGGLGGGNSQVNALKVDANNNLHAVGQGNILPVGYSASNQYWVWNGYSWNVGGGAILFNDNLYDIDIYNDNNDKRTAIVGNFTSASCCSYTKITNNGTSNAYPVITASGPGKWYSIENHTTNQTILIDYTLATGETASLDLRPGQKTFISDFNGNILSNIRPESDISNFYLAPGDNNITIFINDESASSNIEWVTRSWSIDL